MLKRGLACMALIGSTFYQELQTQQPPPQGHFNYVPVKKGSPLLRRVSAGYRGSAPSFLSLDGSQSAAPHSLADHSLAERSHAKTKIQASTDSGFSSFLTLASRCCVQCCALLCDKIFPNQR